MDKIRSSLEAFYYGGLLEYKKNRPKGTSAHNKEVREVSSLHYIQK